MWIDFKPIYNTSESETIFVRRLCPKISPAGAAYSTPQTSQLNLTHFVRVRLARLTSTDSQNYFPVLSPGLIKPIGDFHKKSAAPYLFDWVNTPLKRLEFSR